MTVIEDVGQKVGKHENVRESMEKQGVILRRQKLNVGDYILAPKVSVDTKQGLQEIYSDIVGDHERFRRECIRAQEDGTRLVILIETTDENLKTLDDIKNWTNPRYIDWYCQNRMILEGQKNGKFLNARVPKAPVSSDRLCNMMRAMSERYGVEFKFCHPNDTGKRILEILSEER